MNIQRAQMIATDLIKYYCPEFAFKFDNAKRRFGLCRYTSKRISISAPLTLANEEGEVINTILHEIAHALTSFDAGHGQSWQTKAKEIGNDGNRCYDSTVVKPSPTWIGICPGCERKITRYRRKRISCGKCCKGKFNLDYLFTWVQSEELEKR